MSAFEAFAFWLGMVYLIYLCKVEPLQPDQPLDDLSDVDVTDPSFHVAVREADWMDRPVVNIRLSRRGKR